MKKQGVVKNSNNSVISRASKALVTSKVLKTFYISKNVTFVPI